jgi:hypothetical protein
LAKSVDWTVAIGIADTGRLVALQRWQSDWRNTRERLKAMIRQAPALVDSTGVGDPIVEDLQRSCPAVVGYQFTAPAKQRLMEGLAAAIQRREIGIPDEQRYDVLVRELELYEYEYRPSGVRYTAPEGMHDDCVCALALAVECLRSGPRAPALTLVAVGLDADWSDDEAWKPW